MRWRQSLGQRIAYRTGYHTGRTWVRTGNCEQTWFTRPDDTPIDVDIRLAYMLDVGVPLTELEVSRQRADQARRAIEALESGPDDSKLLTMLRHVKRPATLTVADARALVMLLDPAMFIEAILSREWGAVNRHTRRAREREALDAALDARTRGLPRSIAADRARLFFEEQVIAVEDEHPVLLEYNHVLQVLHDMLAQIDGIDRTGTRGETSPTLRSLLDELVNPAAIDPSRNQDLTRQARWLWTQDELLLNLGEIVRVTRTLRSAASLDALVIDALDDRWVHARLETLIELVRDSVALMTDGLLDALARTTRQPDYSIPRDVIGDAADHVFPKVHSKRNDYVGPTLRGSQGSDA
jgi:hypothetical protein